MEYMKRLTQQDPGLEGRLQQNEQNLDSYTQQHPELRMDAAVVTIPVVFHILYNSSGQNVSDLRINDQIATLNKDYGRLNADTSNTPAAFKSLASATTFQFCLAQRDSNGNPTTGIIRKLVSVTGFDVLTNDNAKYTSLGGDNAWPRNQYLNVWVVNFIGNSNGLLGLSQFPNMPAATDGCCVLYSSVGGNTYQGTIPNYKLGRTLTHEIGHWMNLYHVWGDDNGACNGTDYVSDTPNQSDSNFGCPSFPHTDACTTVSPGVMFMDYMDYVNDNCMNMFSVGQVARMTASVNAFRPAIRTSNGCVAVGIAENLSGFPVSIFPNPSNGNFTISGQLNDRSDLTVTITNMLGEIIFSQDLKNAYSINLPIDLSGRSSGIYNVSLKTAEATVYKKISLIN